MWCTMLNSVLFPAWGQAGERKAKSSKFFLVAVLLADLLKVSIWKHLLFLCTSFFSTADYSSSEWCFKDPNKSNTESIKEGVSGVRWQWWGLYWGLRLWRRCQPCLASFTRLMLFCICWHCLLMFFYPLK